MSIDAELRKGAFINFVGVVGKITIPVFIVVVNRFYGPEVFGIFITANITIEILIAFLTSGFKDGALIFVARFSDNEKDQLKLYNSLVNALCWSIGFSFLIAMIGAIWGQGILELIYEEDFNDGLGRVFQYMLFCIPLMAFERIVLAATQGLKIMKYDALSNGWLRPLALLGFSILFWFFEPNLTGIALAFLSTQVLLFIISILVFNQELSWLKLFYGLKTFTFDKELLDFAIPQNINMTMNRFITGIDVLMLPAFGFSASVVGFYGTASMLIREVKTIKMIFSTAFAPYIVRFHNRKQFKKLSHNFSKTAAWIATLVIPILLMLAIFKEGILSFVHPEYRMNSAFVYFLLPIPYIYCSISLAGNIVAMAGYSKLTLMNSLFVGLSNILMNIIFIPLLGLAGAAIASSVATLALHLLELGEARWLVNAQLYLKDIYRPHVAGLTSFAFLSIGLILIPLYSEELLGQFILALLVLCIYLGILGEKFLQKIWNELVSS